MKAYCEPYLDLRDQNTHEYTKVIGISDDVQFEV